MKMRNSVLAFFLGLAGAAAWGQAPTYSVSETFPVGGPGAWDYLTVDPANKLLYVPRSTHTMVLDAKTGKTIADIPGQTGNHGVALVPEVGHGFITDGKGSAVIIFDLKTNEILGKVKAVPDSDGIIYDEATKKVYFVSGDEGSLMSIDPQADPKTATIAETVDLGGKPEFLASDGHGKLFVNLMDKDQVAVVQTNPLKVLDRWSVAPGGSPVGMAIDREKHRIFVGCRKPQKLIVMSTDDGKVLADLPIGVSVDATKFDNGLAFASCRDGTLTVANETSPGKFEVVQTVTTKPGARTMGVDSETHAIYLPTAELAGTNGQRQSFKPDTFMIVVVKPTP